MNHVISMNLDDDVITRIKKIAEEECRSFSSQIKYILKEYANKYENLTTLTDNASDK